MPARGILRLELIRPVAERLPDTSEKPCFPAAGFGYHEVMSGSYQKVRFERGGLVAEEPTGDSKLWKPLRGTSSWVTNASNNAALGLPLHDGNAGWERIPLQSKNLNPLRPDQMRAVEAWETTRSGILVMPTGTGKTEVAMHITQRVGFHTLFIAPTRALSYQLAYRLEQGFGMRVGFIGDNTFQLEPISVATYKSAALKMEHIGSYFKLLVFDECHHLGGDMILDSARMSAAPYRLGLTATPSRTRTGAPSAAEQLIGPICFEIPISSAQGSILARYGLVRVPVFLTDEEKKEYDALGAIVRNHMAERRKESPDYSWEDVARAASRDAEARHAFRARLKRRSIEDHASEKLNVIEDLIQEHTQQVIIFTGSNKMARAVSCRFLIPCLLASTMKWERERILAGYGAGDFQAIVANKILNEGIDVPKAKVGIVVGGTGSPKDATQRLGRILRKNGEETARLYEVVCKETGEEQRSRKRRQGDAYKR
ncbi:helicase [Spartobacteria bacterium LR76]|nr:helicase [Spartobacteria bacterium LR76]